MTDEARIIPLNRNARERQLERHAYLIQRVADLEVEIALLESERDKLIKIRDSLGKTGLSLVEGEV